jgi:hypothetical protein
MKTKASAGLAATVAILVLLGTALAVGATTGDLDRVPATADHRVAAIAPALPELVGAFRREQVSSDRLAGEPGDAVDAADRQPGEAPGLARKVGVAGGRAIYLWPATDAVCLSHAWSGGCIPTDLLASQGAVVGTRFVAKSTETGAPVRQAIVLARDGVSEVEIRMTDGETVTADTAANAAIVNLAAPAVAAEWRGVDGTRETQTLQGTLPAK